MIIHYGNIHSSALDMTREEKEWLTSYLTIESQGSFRTRGGKAEHIRPPPLMLLDPADLSFPSGYLPHVVRAASEAGLEVKIFDRRKELPKVDPHTNLSWLRDYQVAAYQAALELERGILWLPTGSGKCFGKGTRVALHKGGSKAIEDVKVGEVVLGANKAPMVVLALARGMDELYRVTPASGPSWICNRGHILVLYDILKHTIIEMPLNEFLDHTEFFRHTMRLLRCEKEGEANLVRFEARRIGEGSYYGFSLSGDHRFLLEDGTLVRNTEVAAAFVKSIPIRWLFLTHRTGLLNQTAERFALRGVTNIGRCGNNLLELDQRITIATFQTLNSKIKTKDKDVKDMMLAAEGLIVDECHTVPAEKFRAVTYNCKNARYRIGLSGTPLDRSDRRSVHCVGALGPVIHRLRSEALVEQGVLARPQVIFQTARSESDKPTYQGIYGECIVRGAARNSLLLETAKGAAKPCVLFVREIKHGSRLLKKLRKAGLKVVFVSGSLREKDRETAKQLLHKRDLDVVVATEVWQDGIDIPELASIIVGGGGKSIISTLQRAGRGMRRAAGKSVFQIWDIQDEGVEVLAKHSAARLRSYRREGFHVEFR